MSLVLGLKCKECGREYAKEAAYVCEFCFGPLEVAYDYQRIAGQISQDVIMRRPRNLWRYRELLPLDGEPSDGLLSGFTPLYRAKELGFDTVGCASTGNLANSVSAHGAKAGLKRYIFIPNDLEPGKVVGSLIYQPNLIAVEGNYDDVNRLCSEIASKYRWAFVNVNMRPYYTEGAKTYGFEIAEQLGWRTPDNLVCPVAGGTILPKIWKGLKEFEQLGLIPEVKTKVFAAQAEACAPVIRAIHAGTDLIRPVKPRPVSQSVDTSLRIGNPADGPYVVHAVQASGGWGEMATDDEIIAAIQLLAATEGIWTETAGGTTLAVAKKLIEQGRINPDESTVVCITGNGLKTLEAVRDRIGAPTSIAPTLGSFEERVLSASE
jgi:threonine synthase